MVLFTFEPGDGNSYRVIFGRMPGRGLVPYYTVIGIAEGSGEPGAWYAFDYEDINEETFRRHVDMFATLHSEAYWTAWRLWLALTHQADDPHAAARLPAWKPDWRAQLPPSELD